MNAKATTTPADDELSEVPRYRTVGVEWSAVNGLAAPPGTIFEARFWPRWPLTSTTNLEGENEPARRILQYIKRFQFVTPPVESLWSEEHGRYLLLEPADDYRSTIVRPVPEAEAFPNMPRYRALVTFPHRMFGDQLFAHRTVTAGETFALVTWPRRLSARQFEPANDEAEQVLDYWNANSDHPRLALSPWCWFHRAIFLPELTVRRRQPEAA